MIQKAITRSTGLRINQSSKGETIEMKIDRMVNNKEPMDGEGAPLVYTERAQGVPAEFNPRTDVFDMALEGMTIAAKSQLLRRAARQNPEEEKTPEPDGGESIDTTN